MTPISKHETAQEHHPSGNEPVKNAWPDREDPFSGMVRSIITLQHSLGNRATQRLLPTLAPVTKSTPVSIRYTESGCLRREQHTSQSSLLSGSPYSRLLPGYSQSGNTCAASSLVTALIIWDREHWNAAKPNNRVVTACNLIISELAWHGGIAVERWASNPSPEVSGICNAEQSCLHDTYTIVRRRITGDLTRIRDTARLPGASVSENDYQNLGIALYFLYHNDGQPGLGLGEIREIQRVIGLDSQTPHASGGVESFADIFTNSIIRQLQPDEFAQVSWVLKNGGMHAFLLGHLQQPDEWFLSDQGRTPAEEITAANLNDLEYEVERRATRRTDWLYTGTREDFARSHYIPGWTGVIRLGSNRGTEIRAQNLIPPNAFLGEVDAGALTWGDRLTRGVFIGRSYSLSEARGLFVSSFSGGGLIVEMPQNVFSIYATSPVSDSNLSQTRLDAGNSRGGELEGRIYFHVWLKLGTANGRQGEWFQLY